MKYDKASARKAAQAMLRARVEVAETLRARAEGDFNYEPRDKLLAAASSEVATPKEAPQPAAPVLTMASAVALR